MKWYTVFSGNIGHRVLFFATLAAILAMSSPVYAQCGGGTTVLLSRQGQVDSFLMNYCGEFNGNLVITDDHTQVDPISDFTPLLGLTKVYGNLTVEWNDLTSLQGFNNLEYVGLDLTIFDNAYLLSLQGFSSLTHIGRHLKITFNPMITSTEGFPVLLSIGDRLEIRNNDTLTSLNGFSNLNFEDLDLTISYNAILNNLDGLPTITSLGSLSIFGNNSLSNINKLSSLETIDNIRIQGVPNLTNVDAFSNLTGVSGSILISNNPNLQDLNGFSNLIHIGAYLGIGNNSKLMHLDAFSSVSSLNDLGIINNKSLKSTSGLSSLTRVNRFVTIQQNDSLTAIEFPVLKAIGIDLNISNNGLLQNIANLDSLTHVGRNLSIYDNPSLTEIHAFQNLDTLLGSLIIDNNAQLEIIDGFSHLNHIGQDFNVTNNLALSTCCSFYHIMDQEVITNGQAVVGSINLFNNSMGCNSMAEIIANQNCPIYGCTDPFAHNHNAEATADDGSCETCDDGILNGDEVDIDCGGNLCNPCPPPIAVCGNIVDVYIGPSDLVFNGPGTADVYLVPGDLLDGGSVSSNPSGMVRNVKRAGTVLPYNWTTHGACIDATANGIYNNNDKGIVYKSCLPVFPGDFNLVRIFSMSIADQFGTSICTGRFRVNYSTSNAPVLGQLPAADLMETDGFDIMTLYPNPGSDELNIALNIDMEQLETSRVEITDAQGRLVTQYTAISSRVIKVPMYDYLPGVYTIICHTPDSRVSSIWVKF